VQNGFPVDLLPLLACPADGAALHVNTSAARMVDGTVTCTVCRSHYPIRDGILCVIAPDTLHHESALEMRKRDQKATESAAAQREEWSSPFAEVGEVAPTLDAVQLAPGFTVAELGCGTGRYTMRLLERARAVVAVDFSRASLLRLRERLPADANVVLLQADVTHPVLARRQFDRVLSTLHSNLPTANHRRQSLAVAAAAIRDDGRCVISMHHYGLRTLLAGEPAAGCYSDSCIFRQHLRQHEARAEADRHFGTVTFTYLHATIPGIRNITLSRFAREIPIVRSSLSRLFLAVCKQPKRSAGESH
jgi:uncharacterized protein YbaR (Trm112 family)/phospholipid N-methyltransferase